MLDQNIIEVEKKWAQLVVTNAKSILIRNHKIATGNLINSIKYNVSPNGSVSFSYSEDGKWVTQGRKKNGKFPPPAPIEKWIKRKGISGTDEKGHKIKIEALTFLISRAIAKNGIKPLPFMDMAIDMAIKQLSAELERSIAVYLEKSIGNNVVNHKIKL
jgi:hypothetical protein